MKETAQWILVFAHQMSPASLELPLPIVIHFWNFGSNSSSWERSA